MTLADQIALMEDGKIVQCAPPHELYNHPADRFGGRFLGNPGMVFFSATLSGGDADRGTNPPLFPVPVPVAGAVDGAITIGVRPEHIRVSSQHLPDSVAATLERKSVQIGGQYLAALTTEGLDVHGFKAKAAPSVGGHLPASDPVHVALPRDQVSLIDAAGNRIAATLHPTSAPGPTP